MKVNHTVQNIDLTGNKIYNEIGQTIEMKLRQNRSNFKSNMNKKIFVNDIEIPTCKCIIL